MEHRSQHNLNHRECGARTTQTCCSRASAIVHTQSANESKQFGITSWEREAEWYSSCVGKKGHYYHQSLILPGVVRLLGQQTSLLDLGCGNGVLSRHVSIPYVGVDASPSLIKEAKRYRTNHAQFYVADVTKPLPFAMQFSCVTFILSLQNIADPAAAIATARTHLQPGGILILVLNHPCFRIPRQSFWGIDKEQKIQYRRLNRYLSPLKIPIQHPDTFSFHHSLMDLMRFLRSAGFVIIDLEEWCSDKKSSGSKAKMEDRARKEFPLFLTLVVSIS
jgi:SAM-dependent methyltransferase